MSLIPLKAPVALMEDVEENFEKRKTNHCYSHSPNYVFALNETDTPPSIFQLEEDVLGHKIVTGCVAVCVMKLKRGAVKVILGSGSYYRSCIVIF